MVLTDEQWSALKAALDAARPGTGRPLVEERRTVEGVVWRLRNGARRRAVPAEYGPWWRPAQLHIRWSKAGVWGRPFARLRDAGRPELADVFVGGPVVRAHQKAAGARKKGGPRASGTAARRSAAPAAARRSAAPAAARRSAAPAAASRPSPARRATPPAGRSRSLSCPARPPSWAPPPISSRP
jgi:transposase